MATAYKTPGVYIEEIPKFPPSIAPVETAIPAFIGYTEKAQEDVADDLLLTPTRISSLVEYEELFGGAQPEENITVTIDEEQDANGNVTSFKAVASLAENQRSPYNMYYAMQMFFANGGGPCYIVAVDTYDTSTFPATIQLSDLQAGLGTLVNEDEPTLIVFPDAQNLASVSDFATLHDAALAQCADLQDRFVIMDLHGDTENMNLASSDLLDAVDAYRNSGIGTNNLKYGAVYAPNIETTIDFDYDEDSVVVTYNVNGTPETIAADATAAAQAAASAAAAAVAPLATAAGTAADSAGDATTESETDNAAAAATLAATAAAAAGTALTAAAAQTAADTAATEASNARDAADAAAVAAAAAGTAAASDAADAADDVATAAEDAADAAQVAADALALSEGVPAGASGMLSTLSGEFNQLYQASRNAITQLSCKLPPSGAIAGIYAAVDEERGVWKAPANVSVSAVIRPTIAFSNVEQDQMNVDPTAGKSVNAIRSFVGKGTLVWGARTLAGNDNEWRYVNVRRFFNFVEESVKKATEQFVFEPNDANTWVKVQAMIENFLTTLWRQGALQGVKPEHAFYVAVGLGKTMTALDILEGRMIVEIGMAAVRPAEFIILRFSHKMAES